MNTDIKTLMQMTIGQIKELEKAQQENNKKMWDIIDRQKETVASYLEQEKVDEDWANEFLKEMEIGLWN